MPDEAAKQEPAPVQLPPPPTVPEGVEKLADIEYGRIGDRPLTLDIFLAKNRLAEPQPMIAYVHGGGWGGGTKEWCTNMAFPLKGYACASIGYRLSGEAKYPAQVHDCKAAIRWLRTNAAEYGFDPNRIGVWGASAGGHLVAMLGTTTDVAELEGNSNTLDCSSAVQATCDFCGPTDFNQFFELGGREKWPGITNASSQLIGGAVEDPANAEKVALANPIHFIDGNEPLFLTVHGDADQIVPYQQSVILHEALQEAGSDTTLHIVKDGGHGFESPEIHDMVDKFFARVLKPGV